MTKIAARVLLVALGLALMAAPVLAHASPAQGATQTNPNSRKAYLKHQKQQQKKFNKEAKKSQKQIKKQHKA